MEHRSGERPSAHDEDMEDSENGQLAQNAPIVALKVPTRGLKPIDRKPMRPFPNFARYHMSCVQKTAPLAGWFGANYLICQRKRTGNTNHKAPLVKGPHGPRFGAHRIPIS